MEDVLLPIRFVLPCRLDACVVAVCPSLLDDLLMVIDRAEHLRLVAATLTVVVDDLVCNADLLLARSLGIV